MDTSKRLRLTCTALAAALAMGGGLTQAATAPGDGMHEQAPQQKPPAAIQDSCGKISEAVLYTRDGATPLGRVNHTSQGPDWRGGDAPRESRHAHNVLRGGDNGEPQDLIGERCKMADSDINKEARINDGVDVAQLLDQINELLEFNKKPGENDEHTLQNPDDRKVHLEFSEVDKLMHVFLGSGNNKTDLGSVRDNDILRDHDGAAYRDRIVVQYNEKDKRYQAMVGLNSDNAALGDAIPAVPEPSTWLMLLAGLGLLGLARARRPGAPEVPAAPGQAPIQRR